MFSSVILYPQANDLQLLRSPYYVTAPHSHSHIQEERERERDEVVVLALPVGRCFRFAHPHALLRTGTTYSRISTTVCVLSFNSEYCTRVTTALKQLTVCGAPRWSAARGVRVRRTPHPGTPRAHRFSHLDVSLCRHAP